VAIVGPSGDEGGGRSLWHQAASEPVTDTDPLGAWSRTTARSGLLLSDEEQDQLALARVEVGHAHRVPHHSGSIAGDNSRRSVIEVSTSGARAA
jgi:hypothetical protein